jgi:putative oxidoreductase
MDISAQRTDRHDVALLLLRVVIGAVFVAHGAQKLFGGQLDTVANAMVGYGLEPGMVFAVLAGVLELGGGLLLLVGLLTPLAGLVIAGVMVVAIATVTAPKGFIAPPGVGYEYNLMVIAVALTLVIDGPGRLSLDHWFGLDRAAGRCARRMRQQLVNR